MYLNPAAEFVGLRSYSRWLEDNKRRETWENSTDRYLEFIEEEVPGLIPKKVLRKTREYMLAFEVMPSMRAVWTAGDAARKDNICMYNCAFTVIDSVESFAECLYILMCGTGFGFSVENQYIKKLPIVPKLTSKGSGTFVISDDKKGWADSLKILMKSLYAGCDVFFDYSKIRKKGDRLKTMGGRASGPEPLMTLHNFVRSIFNGSQERKLTSLECHDILNQVAEIVIVGGVRRSSQISLSDLDDELMRTAKVGNFPLRRYMANNSSVYHVKPTAIEFLTEWASLANSGSGERGIFNLTSAYENAPKRRNVELISGTNPCGEIMLRNMQFCNLSEVVVRPKDDLSDLLEKVECATWLGAIQSTFTKFPYLRKKWKVNCEEERLLGVSLTGQLDNIGLMTKDNLIALKSRAKKIAQKASKILDINMPSAITCGKPSGTVSQLVDSASGCHPRYSKYYIRRYRISSTDPLLKLLKDQKVPMEPEVGQRDIENGKKVRGWKEDKVNTWVVDFPIKSPDSAILRKDFNALQQLEHYKTVQKYWCEHNQSCTIYVKNCEWFEVGNWVYKNWDIISGVSFLPFDGGSYELAPYEEIDESTYNRLVDIFPKIDYTKLSEYEQEDNTSGSKSYACVGDLCELK